MCTRQPSATPTIKSSASLTHGQASHHRRSCWSTGKAVTCMRESERPSLWTFATLATNSLLPETRYASRHFLATTQNLNRRLRRLFRFCGYYLQANKVSKIEGKGKLSGRVIFENVLIWYPLLKIIEILLRLSKCSLPIGAFLRHMVNCCMKWLAVLKKWFS